ncbi:MAG: hypothetical protein LQ347_005554 [Umbilicaria vellea]|nr:MAG: hypothetical protein LQ347_005554 [Umbilicaria vellea]
MLPGGDGRGSLRIETDQSQTLPNRKVPVKNEGSPLRWKDRLQTFEEFNYESNLDMIASRGSHLVDQAELRNDFELWLQLLQFRRRTYGASGVVTIFNGILERDINLPTTGPVADELWDAFLSFAFQRRDLRNKFYKYVLQLHERTGRAWPNLYLKVLGHELETVSPHWFQWHQRLRKDFPPSLEHLQVLFGKAMSSKQGLVVFKNLHMDFPFRKMYSTIVPSLCEEGMYKAALKWHHHLMRLNDLPSSSVIAQPLLHHLAIYGDEGELAEITKGMADAGVSFARPVGKNLKANAIISREIMNRIHGEINNIAPKTMSDSFCARCFATRVFPVDMVISVLKALGAEEIGPLSLREIAMRENSAITVSQRIIQLREAGISIGVSRFSMMVRRFAKDEDEELLRSLVASDQHPDELENWKLQESLLLSYRRANDTLQYWRTIAVLTSNLPDKLVPQEIWNLQLRGYASDRDVEALLQTMEGMREAQARVSARTSGYIRACFLSSRSPGKGAYRTDDLPMLVNIWQTILRDGGALPPIAWREVLRRYGMAGRLDELEKLVFWLASWYSDPKARAWQIGMTHYQSPGQQDVAVQILESLPLTHAKHPLRQIFTTQAQEAIIAWGFRQCSSGETPDGYNKPAMPMHLGPTIAKLTWGLRLLAQLKQSGVHINTATVGAACRTRLLILFGRDRSNRVVNRQIRANNPVTIEQMILAMEEIWGPTLFDSNKTSPPPGTLLRLQMIKKSIIGVPPPQLLPLPKVAPAVETDWSSSEDLESPPLFSAG